jgi:thioredoxin-related protein
MELFIILLLTSTNNSIPECNSVKINLRNNKKIREIMGKQITFYGEIHDTDIFFSVPYVICMYIV